MFGKSVRIDSWVLLLIALPGLAHFLIFKYIPLAGNIIAFQEYNLFAGILHSEWVGLKHFQFMFDYAEFMLVLKNSLKFGLYSILFGFPAPLLLALLLNEIRVSLFKRTTQTLLYLPHFLSWVIVGESSLSRCPRTDWSTSLSITLAGKPFPS